jgi:hypothetical protein
VGNQQCRDGNPNTYTHSTTTILLCENTQQSLRSPRSLQHGQHRALFATAAAAAGGGATKHKQQQQQARTRPNTNAAAAAAVAASGEEEGAMAVSIHWFRKGLRLHDNPALVEACK